MHLIAQLWLWLCMHAQYSNSLFGTPVTTKQAGCRSHKDWTSAVQSALQLNNDGSAQGVDLFILTYSFPRRFISSQGPQQQQQQQQWLFAWWTGLNLTNTALSTSCSCRWNLNPVPHNNNTDKHTGTHQCLAVTPFTNHIFLYKSAVKMKAVKIWNHFQNKGELH